MKKLVYAGVMAYQVLLTLVVAVQSHGVALRKVWSDGLYHTELMNVLPLLLLGCALILLLAGCAMLLDSDGRFMKLLVPVFLLLGTGIVFQIIDKPQNALRHILCICIAVAFGCVCFFCSAVNLSSHSFRRLMRVVMVLSALAVLTALVFRRNRTGGLWGETAKLVTIYLCAIAFPHIRQRQQRRLFYGAMASLLLSVLFMRDFGTAIILLCIMLCAMLYVEPGKAVLVSVGAVLLAGAGVFALRLFKPDSYLLERIDICGKVLLDNTTNENFRQLLLSIVRGGALGTGASGANAWYAIYASASQHDFVFLAITATFGVGLAFVILASYAAIGLECCNRRKARTNKRALTINVTGFALVIQATLSILGQLNLIPLTGITTPFLAYGGSSMLVSFGMLGIALSARLSAPQLGSIQFYADCMLDRIPLDTVNDLTDNIHTSIYNLYRKAAHKS